MRSSIILLFSLLCFFLLFGCSIKYYVHIYPDHSAYVSQTVNLSQAYKVYSKATTNNTNFTKYLKEERSKEQKKVDRLFHHICLDKENANKSWQCNVTGYATYTITAKLPAKNKYYTIKHLGGSKYQVIIHSLPMFPNKTVSEEYKETGNNSGSKVFLNITPKQKVANITPLEQYFQLLAAIRVPGTITGVAPSTNGSVVYKDKSLVVFDLNVVRNRFNRPIVINYTSNIQDVVEGYAEEYPLFTIRILELALAILVSVSVWLLYRWMKKR